ncbi:hypothetical protein MP638_003221 [Amoeboaphelidium occidentale]|nr:hypothetical protein MP638_003221 [Amoeboaphelidium occidentale]
MVIHTLFNLPTRIHENTSNGDLRDHFHHSNFMQNASRSVYRLESLRSRPITPVYDNFPFHKDIQDDTSEGSTETKFTFGNLNTASSLYTSSALRQKAQPRPLDKSLDVAFLKEIKRKICYEVYSRGDFKGEVVSGLRNALMKEHKSYVHRASANLTLFTLVPWTVLSYPLTALRIQLCHWGIQKFSVHYSGCSWADMLLNNFSFYGLVANLFTLVARLFIIGVGSMLFGVLSEMDNEDDAEEEPDLIDRNSAAITESLFDALSFPLIWVFDLYCTALTPCSSYTGVLRYFVSCSLLNPGKFLTLFGLNALYVWVFDSYVAGKVYKTVERSAKKVKGSVLVVYKFEVAKVITANVKKILFLPVSVYMANCVQSLVSPVEVPMLEINGEFLKTYYTLCLISILFDSMLLEYLFARTMWLNVYADKIVKNSASQFINLFNEAEMMWRH